MKEGSTNGNGNGNGSGHRRHGSRSSSSKPLDLMKSVVGDVMSTELVTVEMSRSVVECARIMKSQQARADCSVAWLPIAEALCASRFLTPA